MIKAISFLVTVLFTFSVFGAEPVTISMTDGTETRNINLDTDQADILFEVMQDMKAHQYKLDDKIDPISVSGITELQQLRQVIIQIIRGIANQSYRRAEHDAAEAAASNYEPGL